MDHWVKRLLTLLQKAHAEGFDFNLPLRLCLPFFASTRMTTQKTDVCLLQVAFLAPLPLLFRRTLDLLRNVGHKQGLVLCQGEIKRGRQARPMQTGDNPVLRASLSQSRLHDAIMKVQVPRKEAS